MYFLINLWKEIPVSRLRKYLNIIVFASNKFAINTKTCSKLVTLYGKYMVWKENMYAGFLFTPWFFRIRSLTYYVTNNIAGSYIYITVQLQQNLALMLKLPNPISSDYHEQI